MRVFLVVSKRSPLLTRPAWTLGRPYSSAMDDPEDTPPDRTPAARSLRQSSTDAECALWHRLRDRRLAGYKFRRQHPEGPFFADFACLEVGLIVELDGGQHFSPASVAYDARRTATLRDFGFHVMRFTDREALQELDGLLAFILQWLSAKRAECPSPLPSPASGRGSHASAAPAR